MTIQRSMMRCFSEAAIRAFERPSRIRLFTRRCWLGIMAWAALWLGTTDSLGLPGGLNGSSADEPSGVFFALSVMFVASVLCGRLAQAIYLPPLFGMLLIGFTLRNIPEAASNSTIFVVQAGWSSALRNLALVVIMARAGMGLDLRNLRRLSWAVLRLSAIPNVLEAVTDACLAAWLFGMPWTWAFMLGFVISAVSPAVVVPSLLRLKEQHYGTAKGIPDLVLAAASFDDVLSISAFGICLGLAFSSRSPSSNGGLVYNILRAPLELGVGIGGGLFLGLLCWVLVPPVHKDTARGAEQRVSGTATGTVGTEVDMVEAPAASADRCLGDTQEGREGLLRLALILGMGILAIFGGKRIHFSGAGALAVIIMGLVANQGWGGVASTPVKAYLKHIWVLGAQPMLFVLIGSSVSLSFLDGEFVGCVLRLLPVSLVVLRWTASVHSPLLTPPLVAAPCCVRVIEDRIHRSGRCV